MIRRAVLRDLLLCGLVSVQSASPSLSGAQASSVPKTPSAAGNPTSRSRYRPDPLAGHAGRYYRLIWGVDGLSVKWGEAGEVIRFTYEVLDPAKAQTLNDKRLEPSLIDERAQVRLSIPQMDKVGKLRQTAKPEAGHKYWMLFSNKGLHVKRGDHVSIVIGHFRADDLVVD